MGVLKRLLLSLQVLRLQLTTLPSVRFFLMQIGRFADGRRP
jgi:hypothetical protein